MFCSRRFSLGLLLSFTALVALKLPDSASGQVVQLPTQSFFNISTVVKVPDAGIMRLGGVRRFASGQQSRGIPGLPASPLTASRARGYEAGASDAMVQVQIINLEEMEAALMSGYSPPPAFSSTTVVTEPPAAIRRKADFITRNLGRTRKR
jgi:hypothetical protein